MQKFLLVLYYNTKLHKYNFSFTFHCQKTSFPIQKDASVPKNLDNHNFCNTNHKDSKFNVMACYQKLIINISNKQLLI